MFVKSSNDKSNTLKTQSYKPGMCVPVFPADALLSHKQHQFLLEQLGNLCRLPGDSYDELYKSFIHRFVEFVQVIPTQTDEPLCSLMNEGLMRGANALHRYLSNHKEAPAIERYAVFTAAVLQDAAAVALNQKIFIVDEEGVFIKHWQPFEGPLTKDPEAKQYKIMPLASTYQRSAHSITPILARQILPPAGFLWLASDTRLFADWLDALRGEDAGGAGRFNHLIQLVKHGGEGLVSLLPVVNVNMGESPATIHGDAFFTWLKEGLATKQIKVNTSDAGVHVTPQGVFIEKAGVFKQFVDLYVVPVNMFSVYQQVGNLFGLTKLSGVDYRFDQLFSEYPEFSQGKFKVGFTRPMGSHSNQIREGILIADPNLVFTNGEIPAATPYLKPLPNTQRLQNIPSTATSKAPENKIK